MLEYNTFGVRQLVLAGDQGVCGGVARADVITRSVLQQVAGRRPVVSLWDPIHNTQYVQEIRALGLTDINDYTPESARNTSLPDKVCSFFPRGAIAIMPAHGSYFALYEAINQAGAHPVNLVCQLVTSVQKETVRAVEQGLHVAYIGVEGHPETNSVVQGLPPESVTLIDARRLKGMDNIQMEAELQSYPIPLDKDIVICNQTTLLPSDLRGIRTWLQSRYPRVQSLRRTDTCYAMDYLSGGVDQIIEYGIDALVVVGSKHSHNSQELRSQGEQAGIPAHSVDAPEEIDRKWFNRATARVGITSGASVFSRYRDAVVDWFTRMNPDIQVHQLPRRERDRVFGHDIQGIANGIEDFIRRTAS